MATKRPAPEAPRLELPTMAPFDVSALVKMQQGCFDAFVEANRIFTETARAVASCQSEMMRDYVEHMSRACTTLAGAAEPDEKAKAETTNAQAYFEKTATHMRELAELIGKSNADAIGLINGRMRVLVQETPAADKPRRHEHAAE